MKIITGGLVARDRGTNLSAIFECIQHGGDRLFIRMESSYLAISLTATDYWLRPIFLTRRHILILSPIVCSHCPISRVSFMRAQLKRRFLKNSGACICGGTVRCATGMRESCDHYGVIMSCGKQENCEPQCERELRAAVRLSGRNSWTSC